MLGFIMWLPFLFLSLALFSDYFILPALVFGVLSVAHHGEFAAEVWRNQS